MNTPPRRFVRRHERYFSAHHAFLRIASHQLPESETYFQPTFDQLLTSLTFAALSIEAFANALGYADKEIWTEDFERLPPFEKLELLAKRYDIEFDKRSSPWGTLLWLCRLRNDLAHPKSEFLDVEHPIDEEAFHDPAFSNPPKSQLEREISLGNARRAVESVQKAIDIFFRNAPKSLPIGVFSNGWSVSSKAR